MGQRIVRLNELIKREISNILHTIYQEEAVYISITGVEVSPDLRYARVFFSIVGDALNRKKAITFLSKYKRDIRHHLGKAITIKYLPRLEFHLDPSIDRGVRLINYMDEIERDE